MPRLKVLFVVSECVPFAKTGGLGDVAGALPIALAERGHDVRVVLPRYRSAATFPAKKLPAPLAVPVGPGEAWCAVWETRLAKSRARVYLLEQNELFNRAGIYADPGGDYADNLARFTFLSRGALRLCSYLDFTPDVIHVHDWPTALIPVYLNSTERGTPLGRAATVLTIHNLGYQGWFNKGELPLTGIGWDQFHAWSLESFDRVNLLKGGIYHATIVSTVSPTYAVEIQTQEGGHGLDGALRDRGRDVIGILNGIDDKVWDPSSSKHLPTHFSADDLRGKAACKAALQREMGLPERPDVPLFGIISRLAHQKGIDIFAGALGRILAMDVQVVLLGSGEPWAEELFGALSRTSDRFRAYLGMSEPLAHRIEAGSDFFLMPSRYEPCGLNQLYSQRFGTLPIVRAVGGLEDTVDHLATGYKFTELSPAALAEAAELAVSIYRTDPARHRQMQVLGMKKPMGWEHASRQYEALYRMAVARRRR
ncbi:MAG TPA: glycogen/starch synthase [Polyangiaceae bacterium]|jgi:starch synthase|nr:glycogen/starch synthase [Polyangiaceae bacterium]